MTDTHKCTSLHNYKHIHNQNQAMQEKKGYKKYNKAKSCIVLCDVWEYVLSTFSNH